VFVMMFAALVGCSTGMRSERACVPGESRACACPSGAMGAQSCAPDGLSFEMCACEPVSDAGVADAGLGPTGCGDGVCAAAETALSCEADCSPFCGDALCSHGEGPASCAADCPGYCGDTICLGTEAPRTCPSDCPAACGDGACTHDETAACESDCRAMCGDGLCTHTEAPETCPADCAPVCGDTVCSSAGESCGSCALDCGGCLPERMDVFVRGAVIRPWANDNLRWDENTAVDALLRSDVLSLLTSGGPTGTIVAGIASRVASAGLTGFVAPDVYGTARLDVDGVAYPHLTSTLVPNDDDAYQVEFPDAGGWTLPGDASVRVFVFLEDRDISFHDPIGTVSLDEEDLRQAWNESPGGLYWVQVSDQMTPILFVRVLVRESAP